MTYTTLPGLQATIDALACLERSLFHLYQEKAKYHPQMYAAMAEPTVEEILKLRAEIDASIGLEEFATSAQMHNPTPPTVGWNADSPSATTNGQPGGKLTPQVSDIP